MKVISVYSKSDLIEVKKSTASYSLSRSKVDHLVSRF